MPPEETTTPPAEELKDQVPPNDDAGENGEDDKEEEGEKPVKQENRYQKLINQLRDKDQLIAGMNETLKQIQQQLAKPDSEAREEVEGWWKEAFGLDEEGVSQKTFKNMKEFVQKVSENAIQQYVASQNQEQEEKTKKISEAQKAFNDEYESLVEEGKTRFSQNEILAHAEKMMKERATRKGTNWEDEPIPPFDYVYDKLDMLKPVKSNKDRAVTTDTSKDKAGITSKVTTTKEAANLRYW